MEEWERSKTDARNCFLLFAVMIGITMFILIYGIVLDNFLAYFAIIPALLGIYWFFRAKKFLKEYRKMVNN